MAWSGRSSKLLLATRSRKKEVQVKQKKRYCEFWQVEKLSKYTIKYTAKSKFAISKQKGNVISVSYDTNQTIWMGYNFSILNF
jgi:hypothetical protein